jgi:hypothetical protein
MNRSFKFWFNQDRKGRVCKANDCFFIHKKQLLMGSRLLLDRSEAGL